MLNLYSKAGISKPPRAKPTANASNYHKYPIFLADLKTKMIYISPKEESDIRTIFFNWINENRKIEIWTSASQKKKKFFEIAETILNLSRSQNVFDNLSDIDQEINNYSEESFNIQFNLPEADVKWMVEKEKKIPEKVEFQLPTPSQDLFPEPSLSKTLRRIFIMDLIIYRYLSGSL
jgi:hypothetical protein